MNGIGPDSVLAIFAIFCRIGTCLMVIPGFSSLHLPMRIRLLIAIGCTLTLAPPLMPGVLAVISKSGSTVQFQLLTSEIVAGLLIGLSGRYFFLALEFAGAAISSFLGYSGTPGIHIEDTEPTTSLGSLITMTATVLLFLTDLHLEVLRALVDSYDVMEVSALWNFEYAVGHLAGVAASSFSVALQICGPLLVYSVVVNLLFGLTNKLTPQIPIYYVSIPFVIMGGLAVVIAVIPEFLSTFIKSFTGWLVSGAV